MDRADLCDLMYRMITKGEPYDNLKGLPEAISYLETLFRSDEAERCSRIVDDKSRDLLLVRVRVLRDHLARAA